VLRDNTSSLLQHLFKTQWFDHEEENRIRAAIPALTPVNNSISTAVRDQYEDSPYPRWTSVSIFTPRPYVEELKSRFPGFTPPDFGQSGIDILIAGCGTGRHAIMSATHFMGARVLAVDLSLTSLAYAVRSAGEFGIDNIRFAQADILELGSFQERFHIIESVGVLHHMEDPEAGLKILAGLLHKGGLMQLGLYSKLGRRDVAAARTWISERGYPATANGIRQARVDLACLDPDHPAHSVQRFSDFYTLSECRDLLFHVQEHRFRPADIGVMLERCGLEFVGFTSLDPETSLRYRTHCPDDPSMTNLSNWTEFESANPDTFAEMFQFMCRKI
jgi:2-polyprenyl-3-methyl-5-hydroxy-6-metoxy-1,4-benzoquinol methylase